MEYNIKDFINTQMEEKKIYKPTFNEDDEEFGANTRTGDFIGIEQTMKMDKLGFERLKKLGYVIVSYRGLGEGQNASAYEIQPLNFKEEKDLGIIILQNMPDKINCYIQKVGPSSSKVTLVREVNNGKRKIEYERIIKI